MDIVALTFYSIVCGALAYTSPAIKSKLARLMIGACVGLIAAALLPLVRTLI